MSVMHVDYGRVFRLEEAETDEDIRISPALEMLIDAGIADIENGIEWHRDGTFTIELDGPWQGSDYSGDDITESNQRSLVRDFPHLLIDATRFTGHGPYGLQIEPGFGSDPDTAEEAEELARVLIELRDDYPLYDECDHSALLEERVETAWNNYLPSDMEAEIEQITGLSVDLDNLWEDFTDLLRAFEIYPEAEGHRDVILPGIRDREFLLAMAKRAVEAGEYDPSDPGDLTDDGYEVLGSVMAAEYEWKCKGQMALDITDGE